MTDLILYQRDDCHLCDLALAVLALAGVPDFDSVFIDGDSGLERDYGIRVPVLRDAGRGIELDWPFDEAAVGEFLARHPGPSTGSGQAGPRPSRDPS